MGLKVIASDLASRNVTKFDKSLGITRNGEDNLYPSRIERIINGSITAKAATSMYGKFIMGSGFTVDMEKFTVGRTKNRKLTPNKLLRYIANELKSFGGCFIHVNYNANFKIESVTPIPYGYCRFGESDSQDYAGKVVVYNNWDKRYSMKIEKTKFKVINVFNPNPDVIMAQVKDAGGFHKYAGQVYFLTLDQASLYPLAPIDVAIEDAESEYNFAVFRNRTIKKGFFVSTILRHGPFEDKTDSDGHVISKARSQRQEFKEMIESFQGAENAESIMCLEDEFTSDNKDGNLRIDKLDVNYNDKIFDSWTETTSNNIRKACKNIPRVLIDYEQGKMGNTSGESYAVGQRFYNAMTLEERMTISESMKEIFSLFKVNINPGGDWSIRELNIELVQQQTA